MRREDRDPPTTAHRYELDDYGHHLCDDRILTERGNVVDYTVIYPYRDTSINGPRSLLA